MGVSDGFGGCLLEAGTTGSGLPEHGSLSPRSGSSVTAAHKLGRAWLDNGS